MSEKIPLVSEESAGLHSLLQLEMDEENVRCFILADGARLERRQAQLESISLGPILSLLSCIRVNDDTAVGPILLEIDLLKCSTAFIDGTLKGFMDSGYISILASPILAYDLALHLKLLLDIKLADDTDMLMRFYDPRVLPFWFDILAGSYIAHLATKINVWICVDQSKKLTFLAVNKGTNEPPKFPMVVSQEQEEDLMNRCLPYAIIDKILFEDSEAMSNVHVSRQYLDTSLLIDRARSLGFDGMGDLENFCLLGYKYGFKFDEQLPFAKYFDLKKYTPVHQIMAELTLSDWASMENAK